MIEVVSRDIGPDFGKILSELPLSVLNAMETGFVAGMMDRKIAPAGRAILRDIHNEQQFRQLKVKYLSETKKCPHCNIPHLMNKRYCPDCGRYLYPSGYINRPKVKGNNI